MKCRPETPPNTPQWAHAAACQNEQDNCNLDSPEHRRIPHHTDPPLIPPLLLPIPQPPPVAGNPIIPDDPFGPPVQNVSINCLYEMMSLTNIGKQQYNHLPAHLTQQLAALPPLPVLRGRARGQHPPPPPVSDVFSDCFFSSHIGCRYLIIIFQHIFNSS